MDRDARRSRSYLLEKGWEEVVAGLWIQPERDRSNSQLTGRPRLYSETEALSAQRKTETEGKA